MRCFISLIWKRNGCTTGNKSCSRGVSTPDEFFWFLAEPSAMRKAEEKEMKSYDNLGECRYMVRFSPRPSAPVIFSITVLFFV